MTATLRGKIRRSADSSTVAGAYVAARDSSGRAVAGTLTNGSGDFELKGLDADTYTVYASPLDRPVSSANISPGWVIETDFEAGVHGEAFHGMTDVVMDRINELLDEPYRYGDHADSDGSQGIDRFIGS